MADDTNPKDLVGRLKVDLSLVPPSAIIHAAHALMDGAAKYGPYNWRDKAVSARVYISAAQRHIAADLDGEEKALDSGVHHLGHAIACCSILLDAIEVGNAKDDRPKAGGAATILARINAGIAARAKPPRPTLEAKAEPAPKACPDGSECIGTSCQTEGCGKSWQRCGMPSKHPKPLRRPWSPRRRRRHRPTRRSPSRMTPAPWTGRRCYLGLAA